MKKFIARCVVKLLEGEGYSIKIDRNNVTNVEHLQEFGFSSKLPPNESGRGICVFYGEGSNSNSSLLVFEIPKLKPSIQDGETAVFNAFGAVAKFLTGGVITLNGDTYDGLVRINDLTTKLNEFVALYNVHIHTPNAATATTSQASLFNAADYKNEKVKHGNNGN